MALRWYTIVVDCRDAKAQAEWWAEVLGWKKIYESDDEAVIVPQWVTPEVAKATPWDHVGPGLVFVPVPEGKTVKDRLHIDLAAHISDDRDAEIERLLSMGATRVNVGQTGEEGWDVFADPEGNEFCVLSSREF
jgi:catechol 2,3-dioxygenase-like lactoylglutathione lyase family enzyme